MQAKHTLIIDQPEDVQSALSRLGVARDQVKQIAQAAAFARAEYLHNVDPINAAGSKAYNAGVRHMRLLMMADGWRSARHHNIEVVLNLENGIMFGFQNVDKACTEDSPKAISEKGSGFRDLISRSYRSDLFNPENSDEKRMPDALIPAIWLICVSSSPNILQVEISRPKPFEYNQFEEFYERIFIADEPLNNFPFGGNSQDIDDDDLEINISKKA